MTCGSQVECWAGSWPSFPVPQFETVGLSVCVDLYQAAPVLLLAEEPTAIGVILVRPCVVAPCPQRTSLGLFLWPHNVISPILKGCSVPRLLCCRKPVPDHSVS